jgi:hypothetical protein
MQNIPEEIAFEDQPPSLESQEFNSTQILHDYISSLRDLTAQDLDDDGDNLEKFDSLIINKKKPASFFSLLSPTNPLIKPLKEIRNNHLFWKQKHAGAALEQNNTLQSVKNRIAKTLESYKNYFSIKFEDNIAIILICSHFAPGGALYQSIMNSIDVSDLNKAGVAIDAYLAKLTIMSESIKENQDIDKIKTHLLTFPGSHQSVDHACIDGTVQRVQDAIFGLTARSIEERVAKNFIDKSAAQLATTQTAPGVQIHLPPFLLSCLTTDSKEVAKIDGHFASPSNLVGLKKRISVGYDFYEEIKKELSKEIEDLSGKYQDLLNSETIDMEAINNFIEIAKVSGFAIDAYNLISDDYTPEGRDSFESQHLKTKEEFSNSLLTTNKSSKIVDYLRHFPNPRDLLVIKTGADDDETTDELDIKKAEKLVDLFQNQESEPNENTRKGKIIAGLITLRNILSCHESVRVGNIFYFYLKFLKKFKENKGVSFEDFFYNKQNDETLNFKAGVKEEEKEIITTIKSHFNAIMTITDLKEDLLLKCIQTSPEDNYELSDILQVKSRNGRNLLHFLVAIDEKEAFKKAYKDAPHFLILDYLEADKKSLIQILTEGSNSELLSFVLEDIKKIGGEYYLTKVIDDHKLIYLAIKNNNLDALKTIIEIAKSENKSKLEIINSPQKTDGTEDLTMIQLALQHGHAEIVKMLLEKLGQRSPNEAELGAGVRGGAGVEVEEDVAGVRAGVGVENPIQPLETSIIQSLLERNADCNFITDPEFSSLKTEFQISSHKVADLLLELANNSSTIQPQNNAEVEIKKASMEEKSKEDGARTPTPSPLPSSPLPPSPLPSSPLPSSPLPPSPSSSSTSPPSEQPPSKRAKAQEDASINKNLIIGGGALIGVGAGLCVSALTVGIVFSTPVIITVIAGATIGTLAGVAIGTIVEKIQVENVKKNNSITPT